MNTFDMEFSKVLYKERLQAAEALRKNHNSSGNRSKRSGRRMPSFSKALVTLAQKLNAQPHSTPTKPASRFS